MPPPVCHCPRTLRFAMSPSVERQGRPWSATALLSATSLDVERQRHLPRSATALASSALPRHPTSSVEDVLGLPPPSSLPCHLTLSVEDTSPGLPLPSHPPLCHVTQHRASRMPPVFHRPPLCHIISHLALRMHPPTCYCPIKSPTTPHNTS